MTLELSHVRLFVPSQIYRCPGVNEATLISFCVAVSLSDIRTHLGVNAVQVVPAGATDISTRLLVVGYDPVCKACGRTCALGALFIHLPCTG